MYKNCLLFVCIHLFFKFMKAVISLLFKFMKAVSMWIRVITMDFNSITICQFERHLNTPRSFDFRFIFLI